MAAIWPAQRGAPLGEALAGVILRARAATASAGRLHLEFLFENSDAVDAESASWRIEQWTGRD